MRAQTFGTGDCPVSYWSNLFSKECFDWWKTITGQKQNRRNFVFIGGKKIPWSIGVSGSKIISAARNANFFRVCVCVPSSSERWEEEDSVCRARNEWG